MRSPVRLWLAAPKRSTSFLGSVSFCVCVRRTQHRLTACGQHHFERSENIVINKRTQNDVTAEAVNDVMLRINDVLPLAKTMLLLKRKYTPTRDNVALRAISCYNTHGQCHIDNTESRPLYYLYYKI